MSVPSSTPAAAMASVFAAMLCARGLAIAAVPSPLQWAWLPCDDLVVAAGAAALVARWPALRVVVVPVLVAVAALHVLAVRALGRPFLPSMLRGCDAAMRDSLAPYCTWANGGALLLVLAAAWAGGRVGPHVVRAGMCAVGPWLWITVGAFGLVLLLPTASYGAPRNPLFAFVRAWGGASATSLLGGDVAAVSAAAGSTSGDAASLGTAGGASPWHGIAAGRNVLFVVLESAAHRFVAPAAVAGSSGTSEPLAMPFLRSLARDGLDCPTAWAVYPESILGQVPILCALPPTPGAAPAAHAAHAQQALPRCLRAHGYRSGLFHAGRFRFLGMADVLAPMGFDVLADAGVIGGERESSFGIDEEATVDALLRFVAATPPEQRVLACWLPIAGHHPYASPPGGPFATDTMLGCYRNALHYADRMLARLWHGAQRLRPAEQWLVCVVGDHGQAFGEHPGNFGHAFELFEENLRVPLLLLAPGTTLRGVHDAPCSHLDVVPAVLGLLGCGPGGALLQPSAGERTVAAFADWDEALVAVRDARWKLIHDRRRGRDRLFDLQLDPGEHTDVAPEHAQRTGQLRAAAAAFLTAAQRGPRRSPGEPAARPQ